MAKERVKKQFLNGYERILKIDDMIAKGNYPSVEDFVNETGVSIPTINRDLRDLRLKFGADEILQYDRNKKGFYYTRPSFRIPAQLTSEKQIIAAKLMSNLLNLIKDTPVYKQAIEVFMSLSDNIDENSKLNAKKLSNRILFLGMEPVKIDDEVWTKLEEALANNYYVSFNYKGYDHKFKVQPWQLVYSEGMWSLYAYNQNPEIKEIRFYNLPGIYNLEIDKDNTFELPDDFEYTKRAKGNFRRYIGKETLQYKIKIMSEKTLGYIKTYKWAYDQKFEKQPDGSTIMTFTSNQDWPIFGWVMSHGMYAQPLEPEWLVKEWKKNVNGMYKIMTEIKDNHKNISSDFLQKFPVGKNFLGRVIDAYGQPCDDQGEIIPENYYSLIEKTYKPEEVLLPKKKFQTGIRSIDSLLTVGFGQRLGIFSEPEVGNHDLLGMIARNNNADVNVIGFIRLREREISDFIERNLGKDGLKRSIVVVASANQPASNQVQVAYASIAIAEYFREQGKNVFLMMDNINRLAMAQKDFDLSNGEVQGNCDYPPSFFEMISKLLVRTGRNAKGSITAFYNVHVYNDDMDTPIINAIRGILDGEFRLSRQLAKDYHFPAIDILKSISRVSKMVTGKQTQKACALVKKWMTVYEANKQTINSGSYQKGSSTELDMAIAKHQQIEEFLLQEEYECSPISTTLKKLSVLTGIEIPENEY